MTKQARGTAAFVPPSGRVVWTLTNHRMLFCKATLGGSVGVPISSIPVAQVRGAEARRAKVGTGKLRLSFADGTSMQMDLHTTKEADAINRASAPCSATRRCPVRRPHRCESGARPWRGHRLCRWGGWPPSASSKASSGSPTPWLGPLMQTFVPATP